jgi:hypothetical protein
LTDAGPPNVQPQENLEAELAAAQAAENRAEEARLRHEIGKRALEQGRTREARVELERALAIYREDNDLGGVTRVAGDLSAIGGQTRGQRRIAIGLFVLVLVIGGGLAFGAVKLVGAIVDASRNGRSAEPSPAGPSVRPVAPGPGPNSKPVDTTEDDLRVSAERCRLSSTGLFHEVTMDLKIDARDTFNVVIISGSVTDRRGKELGSGLITLAPLRPGVRRPTLTFTVFEDLPPGRLRCSIDIQTAIHA